MGSILEFSERENSNLDTRISEETGHRVIYARVNEQVNLGQEYSRFNQELAEYIVSLGLPAGVYLDLILESGNWNYKQLPMPGEVRAAQKTEEYQQIQSKLRNLLIVGLEGNVFTRMLFAIASQFSDIAIRTYTDREDALRFLKLD